MSKTLQVRSDAELLSKVEWIKNYADAKNKELIGIDDIRLSDADILRWAITELYDRLQKHSAE